MKDPRNFFDKLFRRKTKTVKTGNDSETVYKFDDFGKIVRYQDYENDVIRKSKTFTRQADGSYDPEKTTYYEEGIPKKVKEYSRDSSGMLWCHQEEFIIIADKLVMDNCSDSRYDGGSWPTVRRSDFEYDQFAGRVHRKDFRRDESTGRLIMAKDKTYVPRGDGEYDPKESIYFDEKGERVVKHNFYSREQTPLMDTPLLKCDEIKTDKEGKSTAKTYYQLGGLGWIAGDTFEDMIRKQEEKTASPTAVHEIPKIQQERMVAHLIKDDGSGRFGGAAADPRVIKKLQEKFGPRGG